jgi:hypothetical protein
MAAWPTATQSDEKVDQIHLNVVRGGLVRRRQVWPRWNFNEYAGMPPEEQRPRCASTIDRVRIPAPGFD